MNFRYPPPLAAYPVPPEVTAKERRTLDERQAAALEYLASRGIVPCRPLPKRAG